MRRGSAGSARVAVSEDRPVGADLVQPCRDRSLVLVDVVQLVPQGIAAHDALARVDGSGDDLDMALLNGAGNLVVTTSADTLTGTRSLPGERSDITLAATNEPITFSGETTLPSRSAHRAMPPWGPSRSPWLPEPSAIVGLSTAAPAGEERR
jgi:hypothetical protein